MDSNSGKGIDNSLKRINSIYNENSEKYANKGRIGKINTCNDFRYS